MTEERIKEAAETIKRLSSIEIIKGILRTVAAESRKEVVGEGKVRKVEQFVLRPIDGKGAPEWGIRVDIMYEYLDERDAVAERLGEQRG